MSMDKHQAKRLLVHYFKLAGACTDSDNVAEIESIVDCLVDAAKTEIKAEEVNVYPVYDAGGNQIGTIRSTPC